jgi:hypothetical protein
MVLHRLHRIPFGFVQPQFDFYANICTHACCITAAVCSILKTAYLPPAMLPWRTSLPFKGIGYSTKTERPHAVTKAQAGAQRGLGKDEGFVEKRRSSEAVRKMPETQSVQAF